MIFNLRDFSVLYSSLQESQDIEPKLQKLFYFEPYMQGFH